MHFFSCFNFTVDSPLTKSIFGEHAVIISIQWIVMNLSWVSAVAQNSRRNGMSEEKTQNKK